MANQVNKAYIRSINTAMREVSAKAFTVAAQATTSQFAMSEITEIAEELLLTLYVDSVEIRSNVDEADFKVSQQTETALRLKYGFDTAALKVGRMEFRNSDAGARRARNWATNLGRAAAILPDTQFWTMAQAGTTVAKLDNAIYFGQHDFNPTDASKGNFNNNLSGPEFDISSAVSLEQAVQNLSNAITVTRSLKQSDGKTFRMTRPKYLFVPPSLELRADLLTGGSLGQVAGTDYSRVGKAYGVQAIVVPQLTDTNRYFLGFDPSDDAPEMAAALRWVNEEFGIVYTDVESKSDKELSEQNQHEWLARGASSITFIDPSKMWSFNPS